MIERSKNMFHINFCRFFLLYFDFNEHYPMPYAFCGDYIILPFADAIQLAGSTYVTKHQF